MRDYDQELCKKVSARSGIYGTLRLNESVMIKTHEQALLNIDQVY